MLRLAALVLATALAAASGGRAQDAAEVAVAVKDRHFQPGPNPRTGQPAAEHQS